MHSEHLTNVRPYWVGLGWFVAVAIASAVLLVFQGLGALGHAEALDALWVSVALVVGFGVGGFFTGFRTVAAPILHGTAIAATTVVTWLVANFILGGLTTGVSAWEPLTPRSAALGLLVQGVAAVVGCWVGYRAAPVRVE